MPRVRSFPPIAAADARILILGSMPGEESLRRRRYYAHPQNQFWRIMALITGAAPEQSYEDRVEALMAARIALWDVLRSCRRESSLDSAIERDSMQPNDFRRFLAAHADITHVFFNGATAEAAFRRHVQPKLPRTLKFERLPSTSPAHAGMTRPEKQKRWIAALDCGLR